jgi:hypothetical protein
MKFTTVALVTVLMLSNVAAKKAPKTKAPAPAKPPKAGKGVKCLTFGSPCAVSRSTRTIFLMIQLCCAILSLIIQSLNTFCVEQWPGKFTDLNTNQDFLSIVTTYSSYRHNHNQIMLKMCLVLQRAMCKSVHDSLDDDCVWHMMESWILTILWLSWTHVYPMYMV